MAETNESMVMLISGSEDLGALTIAQILDENVFDNNPPEEIDKAISASKIAAAVLRMLESRFNLAGTVVVSMLDDCVPQLVELVPTVNDGRNIEIPAYASIHIMSLFGANGIDAVPYLVRLGGIAENDYKTTFKKVKGIRMLKEDQSLFEFIRERRDGRQDITRAVFVTEPVSDSDGVVDCVATYDLGKNRFVYINDGDKVFETSKEARQYAQNYDRQTRIEQGDKEA